jgi:tetratricopeptide (TPR) repeat protein
LLNAAEMAQRLGDTDALVAAALANNRGFASITGQIDTDRVAVIESALDAVGPEDSPSRAKLLALLALELTFGGEPDPRRALAGEALAMARRVDDPSVLAEVLDRRLLAVWVPATLSQRMAETAEAEALAERSGNQVANFWACYHRTIAALEAADVSEMHRCAARTGTLADAIGQPLVKWAATFNASWMALLLGDSTTASALAKASLNLGMTTGQPDALAVYGALAVGIRWTQGRLEEMSPTIEAAVAENPGIPALRATLALAHLEAGRPEDARRLLDESAATAFTIAEDPVWLATMALWAEVAYQLGDGAAAATLFGLMSPWRGQIAFSGATVHGTVSHALGGLAAVLGQRDDADSYFAEASVVNEQLQAPFLAARTLLDHGRLLLAAPLDGERGREYVQRARQIASEHSYALLEARSLEALG